MTARDLVWFWFFGNGWRADGQPYGYLPSSPRSLDEHSGRPLFATNAGMYHPDDRPVGLYIENGRGWCARGQGGITSDNIQLSEPKTRPWWLNSLPWRVTALAARPLFPEHVPLSSVSRHFGRRLALPRCASSGLPFSHSPRHCLSSEFSERTPVLTTHSILANASFSFSKASIARRPLV